MNTTENTPINATIIGEIIMPKIAGGFRSGHAFARVNGVLRKIHTSEPSQSCAIMHEQKMREKFAAGEGEEI